MRFKRFLGAVVASVAAAAAISSAAPAASAAASYCTYSLTDRSGVCFSSAEKLQAHSAASADINLAAFYNWINYNQPGGYLIVTGPHACTPPYDDEGFYFNFEELNSYNFYVPPGTAGPTLNNTISSVSTYVTPKCDVKFWENENFTGDSSVWIDRCTHLATCTAENWYDRASSFKLS